MDTYCDDLGTCRRLRENWQPDSLSISNNRGQFSLQFQYFGNNTLMRMATFSAHMLQVMNVNLI